MEGDTPQRYLARAKKLPDDPFVIFVGNVEMHFLALHEDANQAADIFNGFVVTTRERNAFRSRPRNPRRAMWMPFRRKCEPVLRRRTFKCLRFLRPWHLGSVVEALGQRPVRIDAPIAQEWPVRAAEFHFREI